VAVWSDGWLLFGVMVAVWSDGCCWSVGALKRTATTLPALKLEEPSLRTCVPLSLQSECGTSFTHKLEGMFKDIQVSADIMESFKASDVGTRLEIELCVQVQ